MRTRLRALGVVLACTAFSTALAQLATPQTPYPDHYPPALPDRKGPDPPKLRFERVSSVPLPGPLPHGELSLLDHEVLVAVAGGWATVALADGTASLGATAPEPVDSASWIVAENGELRYRVGEDGRTLLAEKASRFARDGWSRAWRLRAPSAIPARPVPVGRRLCYATSGDEVTCVRADNGHRLWSADVGSRVSRPLELWRGTLPIWNRRTNRVTQEPLEVLIAVPDRGDALVALDAWDGSVLAIETLTAAEGWLVTGARVVGPADVAIARQGYVDEDGALLLFRLASHEQRPGPDANPDVSYNPPAPGR
ncbi:MAG TPA: hypothetical protein VF139_14430 [Candidatus Polarisedimenticolaceae bacterium]